jgi:hypothetical protein
MFGIPTTRIAELSRPNYARDVAEYARLEHPQEDARTVILLVLAAAQDHAEAPRRRFWFFRSQAAARGVVPEKA